MNVHLVQTTAKAPKRNPCLPQLQSRGCQPVHKLEGLLTDFSSSVFAWQGCWVQNNSSSSILWWVWLRLSIIPWQIVSRSKAGERVGIRCDGSGLSSCRTIGCNSSCIWLPIFQTSSGTQALPSQVMGSHRPVSLQNLLVGARKHFVSSQTVYKQMLRVFNNKYSLSQE